VRSRALGGLVAHFFDACSRSERPLGRFIAYPTYPAETPRPVGQFRKLAANFYAERINAGALAIFISKCRCNSLSIHLKLSY
jgi:hypothetical protein